MTLKSSHKTLYRYPSPVTQSRNEVRLMPMTGVRQRLCNFSLRTEPSVEISSYDTPSGAVHAFTVQGPHSRLSIIAEAEVETRSSDPFEGINLISPDWESFGRRDFQRTWAEFLAVSPFVGQNSKAAALATEVRIESAPVVAQFLLNLSRRLFESFEYDADVTHVHSTVDEVFEYRAGVCQDFAHVMIACCRSQGVPARYVSGYLYCQTGGDLRGARAMHAWVECALPGGRWLALDPTNNLVEDEQYVRVHVGRDYGDVCPTRGCYLGTPSHSMDVSVSVELANGRPPV